MNTEPIRIATRMSKHKADKLREKTEMLSRTMGSEHLLEVISIDESTQKSLKHRFESTLPTSEGMVLIEVDMNHPALGTLIKYLSVNNIVSVVERLDNYEVIHEIFTGEVSDPFKEGFN